jgi:hypothetical protein
MHGPGFRWEPTSRAPARRSFRQSTKEVVPLANGFELHRLLWDLRHDRAAAETARRDPAGFVAGYDLLEEESEALLHQDFPALLALGANPLLLYFGALEMGVARDDYYASLRAEVR